MQTLGGVGGSLCHSWSGRLWVVTTGEAPNTFFGNSGDTQQEELSSILLLMSPVSHQLSSTLCYDGMISGVDDSRAAHSGQPIFPILRRPTLLCAPNNGCSTSEYELAAAAGSEPSEVATAVAGTTVGAASRLIHLLVPHDTGDQEWHFDGSSFIFRYLTSRNLCRGTNRVSILFSFLEGRAACS